MFLDEKTPLCEVGNFNEQLGEFRHFENLFFFRLEAELHL